MIAIETNQNKDLSLKKAIDKYLAYAAGVRGFSPCTISSYRTGLNHFLEHCQKSNVTKVLDLKRETVYDFLQKLNGVSNNTKCHKLTAIKMFIRFVMQEDVISEELARISNILYPKIEKKIPFVLSLEQVKRLLEEPKPQDKFFIRDKAILELMYATGMRRAEVAGLKIKDLHFDEGYIKCHGKGNKERTVPVNTLAQEAVKKYLQTRKYEEQFFSVKRPDNEYVFITKNSSRVSNVTIWRTIKRYAERAELPEITPHTLRHSFATHLVTNGADLRSVQLLLGHSSIATTEKYVTLDQSRIQQIYNATHPRGRA